MDRHPYNISSPAVGAQFFGRAALLSSVLQTFTASSQNTVIIFGQARSGKTSVLQQLPAWLPDQAYVPVYWGLKDKAHLSGQHALQLLAEAIAEKVLLSAPDLLATPDADCFHTKFLPQVHEKIAPQRLVLLLDDMDAWIDRQGEANSLLSYFPKLLAEERSTAFVLSTSKKFHELPISWQSIGKQVRYEELPFLTFQEIWSLVTERSKWSPIGYLSKTIDAIGELSAGHPYYVQLICHETFDYAFTTKKSRVDVAAIEAVLPLILEKSTPELAQSTAGLSEKELKTLSACALAFKQTLLITPELISDILHQPQIAIEDKDIHQAFNELQKRAILYKDEGGDFCFTLPLMAHWVIERYPLQSRVRVTAPAQPQQPGWRVITLVGSGLALLLAALIGFVAFYNGNGPATATPAAAAVMPATATPRSITYTPTPTNRPALTVPAALVVTSPPTQDQLSPEASSFLPTTTLTSTLLPTETSVPTLTSTPTETTAPTLTPTPTEAPVPSAPTPTPTSPPTPTPGISTGSFTLLHPLSLEEPSYGPTVFEWQWTGAVPAGFGFEVRVWLEGEFPAGAHNAVQDNENGRIESLGDNQYRLTIDISDAAGVRGRSGEYLWTVALVQISPDYADMGQQAAPARLRFDMPGGGGGGGSDGGSGGGGNVGVD